MKCFHHQQADAVAVCRACGRAVCPACTLIPDGQHIVCSERCGTDYEKTMLARATHLELLHVMARSYKGLVVVCRLMAAVVFFLAVALPFLDAPKDLPEDNLAKWVAVTFGGAVVFGLIGVILLIMTKYIKPLAQRYGDLAKRITD